MRSPRPMRHSRFIPTGVGNTTILLVRMLFSSVHPHGRGEHYNIIDGRDWPNGSSPRAWGTHAFPFPKTIVIRFIPTGVGNTGNHYGPCLKTCGSSPRAWGTHRHANFSMLFFRFIPTGVGNTHPRSASFHMPSVHPHGRGEHWPPY